MYDNGTKETWRGWAWNQVASRCIAGSAVGVLCGGIAADYEVSRKKGFTVIGVDTQEECVNTFRKKGGVAIKDDILSQMKFSKFEAIILDELGGLTKNSMYRFSRSGYQCQCIVANYLRGRDPLAVEMQKHLNGFTVPVKLKDRSVERIEVNKHRGVLAWVWNRAPAVADIMAGLEEEEWGLFTLEELLGCSDYRPSFQEAIDYVAGKENPKFYSYKSKDSGQYFDSVAFTGSGEGLPDQSSLSFSEAWQKRHGLKTHAKSKRLAAAAKAVMTKRLECN